MRRVAMRLAGLAVVVGVGVGGADAAGAARTALTVDEATVVETTDGAVRGRLTDDHRIFEGIPYARPPVGDLRLRAPRPVQPWSGVRDATERGSPCVQAFVFPGSPPRFNGSEDCLYLNLHIPREARGPLPVLMFLHGGGAVGSGGAYDPRPVTGTGKAIVVTINYRFGALGFLHHPALDRRDAGTFGLADQQAALRWVRRNVAAFGGDVRNVTLWGESGGGYAVCAQLASPAAHRLFDKAIVQSAPCGNDFITRQEADRRGVAAARDLGCTDPRTMADCLRRVPAQAMASLYVERFRYSRFMTDLPWFPVAGTPLLPLQPLTAARLGLAHDVPLILGGTRDEMRVYLGQRELAGMPPVTAEEYPRLARELYGRDAAAVLAQYPADRYPTPGIALAAVLTDESRFQGTCQQLPYLRAAGRWAAVYAYEFAEPSDGMLGGGPAGAEHGADVTYFFDSYDRETPPLPEAKQRLAARMIEYWTTFARTGRPGVDWPRHRDADALSLAVERTDVIDLAATHRCAFWNAH